MFRRQPLIAAFKTAAVLTCAACAGAAAAPYLNPRSDVPPEIPSTLAAALIATVSVSRYQREERRLGP